MSPATNKGFLPNLSINFPTTTDNIANEVPKQAMVYPIFSNPTSAGNFPEKKAPLRLR